MPDNNVVDLGKSTFTRCKSLVNRPLQINFSDGKGSQRIDPMAIFLVDEVRLKDDPLASAQLKNFEKARKIRVLERGAKF